VVIQVEVFQPLERARRRRLLTRRRTTAATGISTLLGDDQRWWRHRRRHAAPARPAVSEVRGAQPVPGVRAHAAEAVQQAGEGGHPRRHGRYGSQRRQVVLQRPAGRLVVNADGLGESSAAGGEEGHEVHARRRGGGDGADEALQEMEFGGVGLELQSVDVPCRGGVSGEVGGGEEVGESGEEVEVGARAVRDGVDTHVHELLAQVRVPVVLDLVVSSPGQLGRNRRPPT
jgi:hypothetical protein